MFGDRNRPFYKLCDRIILNRIDEEDYIKYFKKAEENTLNFNITDLAIEKIFYHTEKHPYYINLLCSRLWRLEKITDDIVDQVWWEYDR